MKKLDFEKKYFLTKWQLCELTHFLHVFDMGYACAMTVHTQADQLSPQLLMDQYDTLPLK